MLQKNITVFVTAINKGFAIRKKREEPVSSTEIA